MQIDWFTLIAQIINFLILIWLLKRFLYGRIISAMDNREEKIADRLRNAREKREEADREAEDYRQKRQEIQERHDELIAQAEQEAKDRKDELMEQTRREVRENRQKWIESLRQQQEAFYDELRRRTAKEAISVSRRALADLADQELERQIAQTFITRIRNLSGEEREQMAQFARSADSTVVVRSTFDLDDEQQGEIREALGEQLDGETEIEFHSDADLVCGIQVEAGGQRVAWSIGEYLEDVEEEIGKILEEAAAGAAAAVEEPAPEPPEEEEEEESTEAEEKEETPQPEGAEEEEQKQEKQEAGAPEQTSPDEQENP